MSWVAAAIAGGSAISGAFNYFGAQNAANTQVGFEEQGLAAQNQARGQLQPWINTGQGANYTLGQLYGLNGGGNGPQDFSQFTNSPDYAFAKQQGNQGLQAYENANGLAGSGAGLAAASQYNQGLATQQYGNYFNRLMQISQGGLSAATAGVGGANAAAGTLGNIGASAASGIMGGANAISGGINSGISNSLLANYLQQKGQQGQAQNINPSGFAGFSNMLSNWFGGGGGGLDTGTIGGTGGGLGGLY